MTTLEQQIQVAINKYDFDINYHHGIAKNHWGQEYDVTLTRADGYFDLSSVNMNSKEITLKETTTHDPGLQMAQTLAHELGHTDIYPFSLGLIMTVGLIGTAMAMKNKCPKTFGYTAMAVIGYKIFIDEILAEVAANQFHNATLENYITMNEVINFTDICSKISSIF